MRMMENYVVTGDRYADAVITKLIDYLEEKYDMLSIDKFDPFYYECNIEKYVELVYEEFPICADTPNCPYDVEWCWEKFLGTKDGRKAEKWIEENTTKYDISVINEYLDNDLIAETLSDLGDIGESFKNYYKIDEDSKQLSKKDKDEIALAFNEGVIGKLSNGFSFSPSEYCEVVCAINDEDGNTDDDLRYKLDSWYKELKRGNILVRTATYNPRLYNGDTIEFVFEIRIGALIYDAIHY